MENGKDISGGAGKGKSRGQKECEQTHGVIRKQEMSSRLWHRRGGKTKRVEGTICLLTSHPSYSGDHPSIFQSL